MRDDELIRGDIPMTKQEVRAVSIDKLQLNRDSIFYDIGAGTGSVSVAGALCVPQGRVFAIERKQEGASLIRQNGEKFGVSNLTVIEGEATEAMEGLPVPTHAFLGGTSGKMGQILDILIRKNPDVRVVINVITLESLSEALEWMKARGVDGEIVQIQISKSRPAGDFHMMMGQNPVYILSFGGPES